VLIRRKFVHPPNADWNGITVRYGALYLGRPQKTLIPSEDLPLGIDARILAAVAQPLVTDYFRTFTIEGIAQTTKVSQRKVQVHRETLADLADERNLAAKVYRERPDRLPTYAGNTQFRHAYSVSLRKIPEAHPYFL
jgi:hypothetical protein